MKKIFVKTLFIAMSALILHSCELDNYDGPDATLSGRIIDKETGELVEQDIILNQLPVFFFCCKVCTTVIGHSAVLKP